MFVCAVKMKRDELVDGVWTVEESIVEIKYSNPLINDKH